MLRTALNRRQEDSPEGAGYAPFLFLWIWLFWDVPVFFNESFLVFFFYPVSCLLGDTPPEKELGMRSFFFFSPLPESEKE